MSKFLPFDEALAVTRSLKLVSKMEWVSWCKEGMRPAYLPATPHQVYKNSGWQGWGHWLGTGTPQRGTEHFLPFEEALRVARSLRLASTKEWRAWCRSGARPANVPAAPEKAYVHDGWRGYTHWLCHANLDAAVALPEVPQPTRKLADAPTSSKDVEGSRAGKRRRR